MASFVPGFIKRPAKEICNLIIGRVQHEIDEGLLTAQTALRIAKERVEPVQEYVRDVVPAKVLDSYSTIRANKAAVREQAKFESNRPLRPTYAGVTKRTHVSDYSRIMRQKEAALRKTPRNPHRDAASKDRRRVIDVPKIQGLSRKVSVNSTPKLKSDTSAAYMKSLRILYPASDSYEERKKHSDATFTSIFGPEHVHFGVGYASGHCGISEDPVLGKYSYNKNMTEILDHRQAWQDDMRRAEEHEQRKKAEQEAERAEKAAVFKHYCNIYDDRVRKMVNAGGQFHAQIGQVLRAYENGNVQALHEAAHILISNTLEPIMALLDKMKSQVALESMGAQELRNAWPTDSIEQVLGVLTPQILDNLPHEAQNALGYMLQSLRAVCQTIINAVPLINPINEPAPHVFEAKPIPVPNFEHYLSEQTKMASQQAKAEAIPEIKVEPPSPGFSVRGAASKKRGPEVVQNETPIKENAEKNFPSFAAMAAAKKAGKEGENKDDEEAQKVRKRY